MGARVASQDPLAGRKSVKSNNKSEIMKNLKRREFLAKAAAAGLTGLAAPSLLASPALDPPGEGTPAGDGPTPSGNAVKDDISIAQWALVDEIREGKWKTLDFPKVARDDFDINGIEFVNTLFEVPHVQYLDQLKKNADDYGVTMVLIMVDAEGDPCTPDPEMRKQFGINHRKWIDIAQYLGCHSIRTNCRGEEGQDPDNALKWAADSYNMLLEYANQAGIGVLIENHGGFSNDADWMVRLMKEAGHPLFGTYPDWRQPSEDFDNVQYLLKTLPYARGMSYRNQPTEELSARMIRMSRRLGYHGWYGIESSGREAIRQGKEILARYLDLESL